jgi:hypothetical protein
MNGGHFGKIKCPFLRAFQKEQVIKRYLKAKEEIWKLKYFNMLKHT